MGRCITSTYSFKPSETIFSTLSLLFRSAASHIIGNHLVNAYDVTFPLAFFLISFYTRHMLLVNVKQKIA